MNEQQIIRYLQGLCTPTESAEVENWILADPKNANIFFEMEQIWLMKHKANVVHSERPEKAYRRLAGLLQQKSHTPKHIQVNLRHYWKYAVAALIAILITVDIFYEKQPVSNAMNLIEVPNGQRVNLMMSDGTKVNLNSNSRLRYPAIFSDKQRDVELEGEAFFEADLTKIARLSYKRQM